MRFPALLIAMLLQLPACGWAGECLAAGPESDPAWIARAQHHIAMREYGASEGAEGLQAPNRRHAIRTYFEPTGIRVTDRVAGGSPELFALRLARLGRPAALAAVGPGVVTHDGPRIEIRRDLLVEWFVNDPSGLEHGFTLAQRPEGGGPHPHPARARGRARAPRGRCGAPGARATALAPPMIRRLA